MDAPPPISHPHAGTDIHSPSVTIPGGAYLQYEEPSPPDTIGSSNYTTDQFETPPAKRQRLSGPSGVATGRGAALPRTVLPSLPEDSAVAPRPSRGPAATPPAAKKAKRKRSGCLTCRDRHISCDEEFSPDCGNCRKSNRECQRGTRLNFHQIDVRLPPYLLPRVSEWSVNFKDESRAIASEYVDGVESYVGYETTVTTPEAMEVVPSAQQQHRRSDGQESVFSNGPDFGRQMQAQPSYFPSRPPQPSYDNPYQANDYMSSRRNSEVFIPVSQQQPQMVNPGSSFSAGGLDERFQPRNDSFRTSHSYRSSDVSSVTSSLVPIGAGHASQTFNQAQPPSGQEGTVTPPGDKTAGERDYLNDEEEIYYMQVFISEVAVWMDSFDHKKHFSRIVPYHALKSPMLLNALLACGIKHLSLTNKKYDENKVLIYYDTATTQLLRSLQNPDRNMAECAATAAVLNVYEIMSESPQARMSHIAGARALIRECNWNARSTGIGAACFWLNIGMEVLSCLAFNWQTAWDPDQWGLDVSFITGEDNRPRALAGNTAADEETGNTGESYMRYHVGGDGEDEAWVHRIFYIVARIANYRARIPRFQEPSPHDEQLRLQSRFEEWKRLKAMSDRWNEHCPRPMRPMGYASHRGENSLFPNIWLIRRAAVVGRLFYHTAMCMLAQINPLNPRDSEENREAQIHHAHQVCGIVAHTKDHGVASVAIRSLTIASSVLTDQAEQKEVLAILDRIHRDTGWKLGTVLGELKKAWGWTTENAKAIPTAAGGPGGAGAGGGGSGGKAGAAAGGGVAVGLPPPPGMQQGGGAAVQPVNVNAPSRPVHPLLKDAYFGTGKGPYQAWWRPPNGPSPAIAKGLWPI